MGKLKDRAQFATSINKDLKESFQKLSEKTRIPQSKLMDEAIEDLLKKHGFVSNLEQTINEKTEESIPESLRLTQKMSEQDDFTQSKNSGMSEYDLLVEYLGEYARIYANDLAKVKSGTLDISTFLNGFCNHGSLDGFRKLRRKKEG